ncbi:tRNA pseudouridine(55) synthase TruB [Dolichospermum sp. LEGE 00240]|uniref:tRNA pseudouridine(55) synthase TruB n=1 Tax=Dolichospermum sp. LEGE 00240 TaxID=1828603 RepID=UPI00187F9D0A|nr:tRNA pseudouridine(55) synthase TruB [Dolichospermum sp. LEGE 00240]MDM3845306.1 tRNA pseudouridine(55) synthase TruB [Aphanizomenon gracile PMC638.10]MDM3849738.1 tRNA pseudouridine(55) synthase TruB [Aphanizomenon gracile PMC627.10]MDM3857945.1 tRNA pseudouridine(55) synthase TruB [Aphanizomenon gracile PMC649.10]MDM3859780.1 tRNA pseudouridine(55) synthase TruB [Aphanizomenon gracile PMC644.10]
MQGFLNLHKPLDWTSHDCIAKVRKLLKMKRVGHAGTLDPKATGVLPIALGKATRLLQYLPGEKAYQATIRLGIQTTTDDLEGEIITSAPCPGLDLENIKTSLSQFIGKIEQIPPSYSAIQVDGKRLYDLARKGEIVEVPVRTVEISLLQVLDWRDGDFPELDIAISCGAGTYIRAIARDLGTILNTGGTLSALIRTQSSSFQLQTSLNFTDLATQIENSTFQPISADTPLQHLKAVILAPESAKKWCQGQKIPLNLAIDNFVRVYETETNFLGVGKLENDLLVPQMVFFEYPN